VIIFPWWSVSVCKKFEGWQLPALNQHKN